MDDQALHLIGQQEAPQRMDAVSALLRTAMRIAGASAAVVAFDDDASPLAFAGCTLGAATLALQEGRGMQINCSTPADAAHLVLIDAQPEAATNAALEALARELGVAMVDAAPRAEEQLATLAASIEGLADAVLITRAPLTASEPARIAYVNGAFERLFGFATRDLDGHTDDSLFTAASKETVSLVRERLSAGEPVRSIIVAMRSRDNDPLWVDLTARVVRDADDHAKFYLFTLHDITARRAFEATVAAEKQRLSVTLKAIGDAVVTAMPDGRIDFINAAAQRMLGVSFTEAFGASLRSIVELRDERDQRCEIPLDPSGDVRGEGVIDRDGTQLHLAFVSSPIIATSGATLGFVIVLRDVTAEARLTRRLAYEASHDSLTRLPNRRRFEEMISAALESARRNGKVHTVAFIDLDHFKRVNDTLGHQMGDKLLRELAYTMAQNVRGNDILARIGGDEFALLLHECSPSNAFRVADKIRASVQERSAAVLGDAASISTSVGLAALNADSASAAEVLEAADQACYAAKEGGRNAVVLAPESPTRGSS
jgi:diguanylate cyclase (GGDEF)-like protein/PAS domain S-box-containing protein